MDNKFRKGEIVWYYAPDDDTPRKVLIERSVSGGYYEIKIIRGGLVTLAAESQLEHMQ